MKTQTMTREMTDNAQLEKASYCNLPATASYCNLPATASYCNLPATASYCNLPATASYCNLPATASYCNLPNESKQIRPRVALTLEDPFEVLAAVA